MLKTKKVKKEFRPKPWLKKPDEEKVVMVYGYVKAKHKNIAQDQLEQMKKASNPG